MCLWTDLAETVGLCKYSLCLTGCVCVEVWVYVIIPLASFSCSVILIPVSYQSRLQNCFYVSRWTREQYLIPSPLAQTRDAVSIDPEGGVSSVSSASHCSWWLATEDPRLAAKCPLRPWPCSGVKRSIFSGLRRGSWLAGCCVPSCGHSRWKCKIWHSESWILILCLTAFGFFK